MKPTIVLDSGPLGILTNPRDRPHVLACRDWLAELRNAGCRIILPEIADYEIRRELLRMKSLSALNLLDKLEQQIEYLPLHTAAMRMAAELWAQARIGGRPTAPDLALDGDVILAAQALCLGVPVVVATMNAAHLSRFVPAELWSNLVP